MTHLFFGWFPHPHRHSAILDLNKYWFECRYCEKKTFSPMRPFWKKE